MPAFAYEAIGQRGRTVSGVEKAPSSEEAERSLRARGLRPLGLAPASAGEGGKPRTLRRRRADVAEAFRYLSTLLAADFTLHRALATAERLVARRDVTEALGSVRARVQAGASLSTALSGRSDVFPRLAVGMTRAGERGGRMPEALRGLADHLDREERLRRRLLGALLYPALVATIGGLAILVLTIYVLPRFVDILEEAGAGLPRSTALLLAVSGFIGRWWPPLLLGSVVAAGVAVLYIRSETGRVRTSELLLRLPLIGPLRRRIAASRFGRSLSTLLDRGLPILPALEAAGASLADPVAEREVAHARERVRAGETFAAALEEGRAFPRLFLRLTALGEEGGRLPEMLERAASVAEEELERRLEGLVRLVEPVMIVLFGGVVALVALSLLQAIYGVRLGAF